MVHNTFDSEKQTLELFDSFTNDFYNLDVDPDHHFFYYLMFLNSSYFTETQLTDLCIPPPLYVHLDIRSLPSNYDKFIHYLSSLKLKILSLLYRKQG